jgi:hypothetical protein
MKTSGMKIAAAMAAVQLYLQQEREELAAHEAFDACGAATREPSNNPVDSGPWGHTGRLDMMAGRRMVQMRAIAGAR